MSCLIRKRVADVFKGVHTLQYIEFLDVRLLQRHKKKADIGRRYFNGTLSEAIMTKPMSAVGHAKGGALFNIVVLLDAFQM